MSTRSTIAKIEKGYPTTSMGSYGAVLFVLGMEQRLSDLIDSMHEPVERSLEDENLPQRAGLSQK